MKEKNSNINTDYTYLSRKMNALRILVLQCLIYKNLELSFIE